MVTDLPRLPFSAREEKLTVSAVPSVTTCESGLLGSVLPSNVNDTLNLDLSSTNC